MSAFTENLQYDRDDVEFEFPDGLPKALDEELTRLEEMFTVNTVKLKKITERFDEELQAGLKGKSDIPMNITWVTSFPTGHETGTYLTIDLGGTNMRICLITLTEKQGSHDVTQEKYPIPAEIKTGAADELFDHIADSLGDFVSKHVKDDQAKTCDGKIPLGFTFSYPATQHRIDHGVLQTWTKGWDVDGVEGKDAAALLKAAIEKRDLPVKLIALINDTTGALIASAYNDPETIMGAIFGTGCNGAYMERVSQIPKMELEDHQKKPDCDALMAINCEYGAFDNSRVVLPHTKYDQLIDEQSPRPGEQTFEKMSAGLYLGELLRQIMLEMHHKDILFPELSFPQRDALETPYILNTEFLATLENDPTAPVFRQVKSKFQSTLEGITPSTDEAKFLHWVAKLIAIRGARLSACGAAAVCLRKGVRRGHVAVDGSVATKHPRFKERIETAIREILDMRYGGRHGEGVELTNAEDGSGLGAAVICALTLGRGGKKTEEVNGGHEKGVDADMKDLRIEGEQKTWNL